MEATRFSVASLAVSGKQKVGVISAQNLRTLTLTARVTYNASATAPVKVNVYHTPDGKVWDTVPYVSFTVTLTAGSVVQRTVNIVPPEEGTLQIEVENTDATYTATEVGVFYRASNWSIITTGKA